MAGESLKTLFHPFEAGELPVPSAGKSVLFLGAEPGFRLPDGFDARLSLVQGLRPYFRSLNDAGFDVAPRSSGDGYDMALVLCARHRRENEARIADAVARVGTDGMIVVAGGKSDGIDSLRRNVAKLLPVAGHLAKHHGTVFWLRRSANAEASIAALRSSQRALVDGRFTTAPGMFSPDHVDPGSRMLLENLPSDISGAVADFGAGWGYLAAGILSRPGRVSRVDLFEADFEALEAGKKNLAFAEGVDTSFLWIDLLSEAVERRYDVVVMNPPFHSGRAANPELGQGMIRAASRALKPGGRLFMVANRQLPYERVLESEFKSSGETCRDNRFKVLWARK